VALWLIIDWVVVVFPSLWLCRHVLDIEHLIHILGKHEWFVFVPNIVCHPIMVVDCYATSRGLYPLALEQGDLKSRLIVKFPYLYFATIVCLLIPTRVGGIYVDTIVLVGAPFILCYCVKYISIYPVPFLCEDML